MHNHNTNNLYNLLIPWIDNYSYIEPIILTDIQLDSRNVVMGNLFIAIKGFINDGRLYIDHAIRKGAVAVLSESYDHKIIKSISKKDIFYYNGIPVIHMTHLRQYLSDIAGRFYNHPSRALNIIGVTGTNGKTTITHLLARWVQLLGEKSAVMGTLGNGILDKVEPSYNTTCSAIDMQRILARLVYKKTKFVAIEVSSHGLDQYRVDALYFKVAIFSNLSHDHLDYHENMIQYAMSKLRLFNELYVEKYIINADDRIGFQLLSLLPQAIAVTVKKNNLPCSWRGQWISAIKINCYFYGTDIIFNSSWGKGIIHSQLLGIFNVSNLLLALGALLVLGYPLSLLLHASSKLKPICGRMEVFRSDNKPTVIVDYAHTPDALEKVFISIKQYYCNGILWCIFGCGGDRDQRKRALMGSVVEQYADRIIITNDNPRTEDPQLIIDDIICGMTRVKNIKVIQDRSKAIQTAIIEASSADLILIMGKGHERDQIIGNNYIYHSDQDTVNKLMIRYDSL